MIIVSTLRKMHENTIGYQYEDFIRYVHKLNVDNLIVTYTSRENFEKDKDQHKEIAMLQESFNVYFPEIDYEKYMKLSRGKLFEIHNAEEITKKNIILSGHWCWAIFIAASYGTGLGCWCTPVYSRSCWCVSWGSGWQSSLALGDRVPWEIAGSGWE